MAHPLTPVQIRVRSHSHLSKVQQSDRDVRGVHVVAFVIVLQARCQQVTGVWVGVKQTRSEDHDTESKNLDSNGFVKNCFSELSESMWSKSSGTQITYIQQVPSYIPPVIRQNPSP
jgi:hypothetical protein